MSSTGYRVLPNKTELRRMRRQGMTQQQIADEVFERTGYRVTRNAVTMALARAGLSGDVRRYDDLIPWKVRETHQAHYSLAMLRLEARRRRGLELTPASEKRLDSWLHRLETGTEEVPGPLVVTYVYDSPEGFYHVPRTKKDKDIIRRPPEE